MSCIRCCAARLGRQNIRRGKLAWLKWDMRDILPIKKDPVRIQPNSIQ